MAEKDLGSIPYTNINQGTREVDRSAEGRAFAQGLNVTKQLIDEGIKGKVTADMQEAINEVASPQPSTEPLEFVPGSREEYLSNKMDRLVGMIEQGKVSQRTLAEQQVKTVLAEAQAKYGWLYDDLQRRAGAVLTGSARMEQLGIDDAARAAAAKHAQSEYDDIVDHARLSFEKGGLGIDPQIDPRSAYFVRLYQDRQDLQNTVERSKRTVAMAIANANISIHDPTVYQSMTEALQGRYSNQAAEYLELKELHGYDNYVREVTKGAQGDLTFIEQFRNVNADAMMDDVRFRKATLQALWDDRLAVEPDLLRIERGKDMQARFEDAVEEYDSWIDAIKQIKDGVPNAEQIIQRSHAIRANNAFMDVSPLGQKQLSFFTSPVGSTMLELQAQLKNPSGINLGNRVALAQQTHMNSIFPELFDEADPMFDATNQAAYFKSTGALQIPPGAPASEIQDRINQVQTNPNATWVVPGRDGEEETILALQNKDLHLQLLQQAESVLTTASPDFANTSLLGITYSLSYLNDGPNAPNVQQDMLDSLANGALDNAVNVSLTGAEAGRRQAFGAEAEEFYQSTNPHRKRQEVGNHYREYRVGGVALSEMVRIDVEALDDGRFSWVIDEEKLNQAGAHIASMSPGFMTTEADERRGRRKAEQKINEEMQMILNTINQQIQIEMILNKAKAAGIGQMKQEDEWTAFFLGAGDPAGQQLAWAKYFNYTEQGSASRSR